MSRAALGQSALLVAITCVLAATARAQNAVAIASSEPGRLIVTGTTRPVRIQVVMVGRGPALYIKTVVP